MATVTQSEFDHAYIRRSSEDLKRILDALKADGTLTIEADPAPEEPEPQLDADGNPLKDSEGNPVLQAPRAADPSPAVEIALENMPREDEPKIPEGIVVEVAPGTQNAAAPFPDDVAGSRGRRRSREKSES